VDHASLRALEAHTYRAVVDDGVWDLVLGVWLLLIGLGVATGFGLPAGLLGALAIPTGATLRRTVTAPRVGYVRFNAARATRLRRGPIVLSGASMTLLLALLASSRVTPAVPDLVRAGIVLALPIALAAYLFDISRLYAYALVVALAVAVVLGAGVRWEWTLLLAGAIVTASGTVVLTRFLRRYDTGKEVPASHA
jgi:hypothetical protein